MTKVHLSNIFEGYTTLAEIQLLYFSFDCPYATHLNPHHFNCPFEAPLKLPPQLKRFKIEHYIPFKIGASLCTQLESL
jgi:hypothetical protein